MAAKVSCLDCGYLQALKAEALWEQVLRDGSPSPLLEAQSELSLAEREQIKLRNFPRVGHLDCYRRLDLYPPQARPFPQKEHERQLYSASLQIRRCSFQFPYSPGHSPREHLQSQDTLQQIREERRSQLQLRFLLSAALGTGFLLGILVAQAL